MGPDRLRGFKGDDSVKALGGDDCVEPGKGRDRVHGGDGQDQIDARDSRRDRILCGRGEDVVFADREDSVEDCERVREPKGV